MGLKGRPQSIPEKQAAAAVGQSALMWEYEQAFKKHGIPVGQVLLTGQDISDRSRYLNARNTLLALLGSPNIASKRYVFEQYDSIVGSRTARRPGTSDAAVLVLAGDHGRGALAVSIDGNGRRVACDHDDHRQRQQNQMAAIASKRFNLHSANSFKQLTGR